MRVLRQNQEGFTIVELIVALVVASILTGSVFLIYTNQVQLSETARGMALASAFAEGKVEDLRSAGYLSLTDGTTDITSELPGQLNAPKNGTMTVSSPSAGIKEVEVSLTFHSKGEQRTETYTTLIGELGAGQY
jgi:prepilin-type N-terminal cleavage/methylation domain-containing protein